jgi:ABC-type dipeptide/oligopeptide/nickel transport system permease component
MSNNRGVLRFIARRLALGILTLLVVSLVVFAATQLLPSDPATAILGRDANPTSVKSLREKLGLQHTADPRLHRRPCRQLAVPAGAGLGVLDPAGVVVRGVQRP